MSHEAIGQGIEAIKAGNYQLGAQLLNTGLSNPQVPANTRAIAYQWLAETHPDISFKIQCYQAAAQADPTNQDILARLNALISSQLPPAIPQIPQPPVPLAPPPTSIPKTAQLTAQPATQKINVPELWEFGIEGGANGIGTGFMVVRDGLVATNRFVVGKATRVTLITRDNQQMDGTVVRSYPQFDLAFIRIQLKVPYLRDITPLNQIAPEMVLISDDYTESKVTAKCRSTKRKITQGWFSTTFEETLPTSFNGAPIIDDKDDLVGMLTRNTDRNSRQLYGIHIGMIRHKIEEYYLEMQNEPNRIYCCTCGNLSRAGYEGLYYCEICGALFPEAERLHRTPHPRAAEFYDSDHAQKKQRVE